MKPLRVVEAQSLPVRKPISGPREKLRDLLDQQARAASRIKDLELASKRLDQIFARLVSADAAVKAFNQAADAEMLAWSKASLKKDAPVIDSETKLKLITELAEARDQAHAASSARSDIGASIQRESIGSHALEPAILETIVEIIIESTAPMVEDLKNAQIELALKQGRLNQAVQEAATIARSTPDGMPAGSTGAMIASLIETFRATGAPAIETTAADVAAWRSLAARLRTDPLAVFEI
jgi:hypothetical protein